MQIYPLLNISLSVACIASISLISQRISANKAYDGQNQDLQSSSAISLAKQTKKKPKKGGQGEGGTPTPQPTQRKPRGTTTPQPTQRKPKRRFDDSDGLTTYKLRELARNKNICNQKVSVSFNQCVGGAFQNTITDILKIKEKGRRHTEPLYSARRVAETKGKVRNVIPDIAFSFIDTKTKKVYDTGGYGEVKAVN